MSGPRGKEGLYEAFPMPQCSPLYSMSVRIRYFYMTLVPRSTSNQMFFECHFFLRSVLSSPYIELIIRLSLPLPIYAQSLNFNLDLFALKLFLKLCFLKIEDLSHAISQGLLIHRLLMTSNNVARHNY